VGRNVRLLVTHTPGRSLLISCHKTPPFDFAMPSQLSEEELERYNNVISDLGLTEQQLK
jgi:hypothetical protein